MVMIMLMTIKEIMIIRIATMMIANISYHIPGTLLNDLNILS